MKNTTNYQDTVLNELCQSHVPCTLFLMNGFQMRGIIRGFDAFVVMLESEGRQQIIYKHAISTIAPSRPITWETT